jgi:hypothetical protein
LEVGVWREEEESWGGEVRGSIYGGRGNDATEAGLSIFGGATVQADIFRSRGDRRIERSFRR